MVIKSSNWYWYLAAFAIAACLVPLIKRISARYKLFARQNERTIHHGHISRLGGISFYVAFMAIVFFVVNPSRQMQGILIGGSIMFFTGLADDLFDLKPWQKILMQLIATGVLIFHGVAVDVIRLPFGIVIDFGLISILFTIFWVVGITNAMNLMDGLDGLAGGMSSVFFVTVICIALIESQYQIVHICSLLVASLAGFMLYNIHPASIFMGDCGALFLGFMVASISLVGFKSSTIITLALPILIMVIPITDVLSAMLRRKLLGESFTHADKKHLHHQLMRRFGHGATVMIMCGITAIFGFSAFIYLVDKEAGLLIMLVMFIVIELFIEITGMISDKFHPILSIWRKIVHPRKRSSKS